jgi:hypothetical protein
MDKHDPAGRKFRQPPGFQWIFTMAAESMMARPEGRCAQTVEETAGLPPFPPAPITKALPGNS